MSERSPRIPGFEKAFAEESRRLFIERARFLLWSALVLYPAFGVLDLLVAPNEALRFLGIRAGVCCIYLVALAAVYSRFAARLAQPLVMVGSIASAAGISLMAAYLDGFSSNYFAGIVIVIFVIGVFIPWELIAAAALCASILLTYLGINLVVQGPSREMVGPLFFLAGSGVFTWLAAVSSRRTRRRDLSLRLRLQKANEELKELDEAKTRFFANVSHELRTPLTLLLGPLETLMASEEETARRVLLESMSTNARRLLRQVNALLDGAKLESGRLRLEPSEGNLGQLLADLAAAARPHAERRGIRLLTEGLDEVPDSVFDAAKTETIAANLISNALKFTPPGGRVTVRAAPAPADTGRESITFEVEDDGPGIPEEELERIFERFHQVEGPTSREQGGTGLGLALARELARLHGGTVGVRSQLGVGSTFHVELPRDPGDALADRRRKPRRREDQLAQARAEVLAAREYALQSLRETLLADIEVPRLIREGLRVQPPAGAPRILLVEDNADLRNFVAARLARRYRVDLAADGAAGLEAACRTRPDLIVSDVMMPRMDGFELCRRLKSDPAFAATPILLLTARAGTEAVAEGLDVGADDYVVKPFALRELEARIAAHLRAREIERQLHERESRLAAIGQMTSSVVHDLRNPLTLVKGYADLAHALALRGGDAATIARDLETVRTESDRLRRMIEEILDFARGGSPRLALETVAAGPFLDEVLRPLAADLKERGIEADLDVRLAPSIRVTLDRDRIQRVLENLVTNAREALAVWGREKRIAIRACAAGGRLTVRVADSGPGIPEEAAGHLFEPFATNGKKQGTGLGLVTVRNLVKAHGGEIEVETRAPEGGAAFTISLPLATVAGAAARVA
ncbi:MAG TPA: ATP-binding protein [Thermoanaerobaculia bacterium]|jgi:signal transduction histidine kinase|nr:ATP-binding protein [Thermoanaerobaculia bacterium]